MNKIKKHLLTHLQSLAVTKTGKKIKSSKKSKKFLKIIEKIFFILKSNSYFCIKA